MPIELVEFQTKGFKLHNYGWNCLLLAFFVDLLFISIIAGY